MANTVNRKVTMANPIRHFDVCAAMLENRGIGRDGTLPWPRLSKDYRYYMHLTSHTEDPSKKSVNIMGRKTWEDADEASRTRANVINIVISTTMRERPPNVHYLVRSFEEALDLVSTPPLSDQVERVWVMGGQGVYEQAVESPYCRRLYITRILAKAHSDRFFPEFDDSFHLTRDPIVEEGLQEENGFQFMFEVYEKRS